MRVYVPELTVLLFLEEFLFGAVEAVVADLHFASGMKDIVDWLLIIKHQKSLLNLLFRH